MYKELFIIFISGKLIKELQDEVNKLILRVKQLTILLKKASISIPVGPDIKSLGPKRLKWSGKLKPEDVENSVIINKDSKTREKALSEKGTNSKINWHHRILKYFPKQILCIINFR